MLSQLEFYPADGVGGLHASQIYIGEQISGLLLLAK